MLQACLHASCMIERMKRKKGRKKKQNKGPSGPGEKKLASQLAGLAQLNINTKVTRVKPPRPLFPQAVSLKVSKSEGGVP